MGHFGVKDGLNKAGDYTVPRVEWSNEPVADNVLSRFGYFD